MSRKTGGKTEQLSPFWRLTVKVSPLCRPNAKDETPLDALRRLSGRPATRLKTKARVIEVEQ